jgi:hypothetical protein
MGAEMDLNWTSKEDIALTLIFGFLGESRYDRTMAEYFEIEARLPKVEAALAFVNSHLGKIPKAGYAPYEICYCKKGDYDHSYEPFPTSLSKETIRKAIGDFPKFREQLRKVRCEISQVDKFAAFVFDACRHDVGAASSQSRSGPS